MSEEIKHIHREGDKFSPSKYELMAKIMRTVVSAFEEDGVISNDVSGRAFYVIGIAVDDGDFRLLGNSSAGPCTVVDNFLSMAMALIANEELQRSAKSQ